MILAHELADVRRHDMWVNLLQRLAETVLFFNPPLWYLSRRIASLREYRCDELACRERRRPIPSGSTTQRAVARIELDNRAAFTPRSRRPGRQRTIALGGPPPRCAIVGRTFERAALRVARQTHRRGRGGSRGHRGSSLLPSVAQTADNAATTKSTDYPPPPTESDRVVAAARARTFGLQSVPRISLRQTYWNADVVAMQNVPEKSLKRLWEARGQAVDESMHRKTTSATTLAWDGKNY